MNLKYSIINLFLSHGIRSEYSNVLMRWNDYFKKLSAPNKNLFIIRTILFIKTTDFESEQSLELTNEMKIIISSAFVQITFGLNNDVLEYFNHINIVPRSYSYKHIGKLFDGDVNPYTHKVNLSWPTVKKGFEISDDGINLTIHEFGHCLILENSQNSNLSGIFDEQELENYKVVAKKTIEKIRSGENKVLRKYGGTNLMELFSVSLEEFFERPKNFYDYEPNLFYCLCRLLNQDPRNNLDPKLTKRLLFKYPSPNTRF